MSVFPDEIVAAAKAAHSQWSIFASVQLAQWALESDYGRHMPRGSNNPFGIKAHPHQSFVACPTHEFLHGRYVKVMQNFAKFATIGDAFERHAELLAISGYYAKARHEKNPKSFANDLTGIYATDPHYGEKLIAIMDKFNLYQYDA